MKPTSRDPSKLSESVHQRLNMYAVAATAAGVGMLALSQPAEARIVYTSANITIPGLTLFPLDLNHDGVNDMSFYWVSASKSSDFWVSAPRQNGIIGYSTSGGLYAAFALKRKVRVGPKGGFESGKRITMWAIRVGTTGRTLSQLGPWVDVHHRYLGVKFLIKGQTHYGWVRLNVTRPRGVIDAVITGYAYETIPNMPIDTGKIKGPDDISVEEPDAALTMPTPEPATLGALAMGAPGLSIWRRKEGAESTQ